METESVLHSHITASRAIYESIVMIDVCLKRQCGFALIVYARDGSTADLHQSLANVVLHQVHAHAMRLHNGCVAIAVDDKTGKIVAFAMHKTEHIVVLTSNKTYGGTHIPCRLKTGYPEVSVNLNIAEREHSHGNAANLIHTHGDEVTRRGHHSYNLALLYTIVDVSNCSGEDPRMEALKAFLLTFL